GLWRNRELARQFTLRQIELRHKGSHLGLFWSLLNPLLMLGLYLFVFGYILGGRFGVSPHETRADFALGIFIGLSIVHLLAEVIGSSPSNIVAQPNFVKKVVFPLEILPLASVGASVFHFLISIGLVMFGIVIFGPGLSWAALWVPVIVLPVVLTALGMAWFISALGVFFRDIGQITQFLTVVLMYASAVFYSAHRLPPIAWMFLRFNPLLHAIELTRNALLWHLPISGLHLLFLYVCGVLWFAAGHAFFVRLKPAFADVL
ncbi:MAG: ABC transporter permease, partial [Verrucomicrobiota bacterium]